MIISIMLKIRHNELWNEVLPGYDEEHTTDTQTSQQNIHPDVRRERIEEGEDARVGAVGFTVQDADAQSHEGFGEVNHLLSDVCDGERRHGQIRFLSIINRRHMFHNTLEENIFQMCPAESD